MTSREKELLQTIEELKLRLQESEETLEAIRCGSVDALVVSGPGGEQVFTLKGADRVYRSIVETMSEASAVLDRRGDILYMNQQLVRLLGLPASRLIGSSFFAFADGGNDRVRRFIEASLGTGEKAEFTLDVRGTSVPVLVSGSPLVLDEGPAVCLVITDLTVLKSAEHELRKMYDELEKKVDERTRELARSEKRYRSLFESSMVGVMVSTAEGTVISANREMCRILGMTEEEIVRAGLAGLSIPDGARDGDPHGGPGGERLPEAPKGETFYRRKDGTPVQVEVSSATFEDSDGRLLTSSIVRDITDRKAREARLARLTQLHAMLVRVSETIVRTRDRETLFNEVCSIIGEEGGFPLVWIGEVREGQVRPLASCGPAMGYLSEIRVTTDGEMGQGPTGKCVREGRSVINNDFDVNQSTAPWRGPALARGFRTSAAFPLRCEGKVVAVLTLYATRAHDFDSEQVELLQALAADVSYALDTIEQERQRRRAEADLTRSSRRFELLAHTAEELLQSTDPQKLVDSLCRMVMEFLGCQAFFNFLSVEEAGKLRLNAYAGIPEEEARKIRWLEYGVAICGCAAQEGCRIVAEHIPSTPDPRTDLVKSYGIRAYACHPLFGTDGKPMGTLSFGTKEKETFTEDDLSLMKAVADQVSVAMIRMKDEEALKRSRDELEVRVRERTAELRESELHYHTLFDAIDEGFCVAEMMFDEEERPVDCRFLETNPSFEELTGLKSARGRKMSDLVAGQGKYWVEVYGRVALTGEPARFQGAGEGGAMRWHDAYVFRFGQPENRRVGVVLNDITEQKAAEEALRRAGAYNRSLIEASLDPLVMIDRDGRISDVNAATEQVTGYSREELVGADFSDYFTNPERAKAVYMMVFDKGLVRDYPLEIRHRDGTITPVLYNASVYRDDSGSVIGVFAAARDVSDQQRLQTQLRQAQKMEALGTLSGGIAHDFNNMLAAIIGFTEIIKDHLPKEGRERHYAQRVLEAGIRGRDLVKQMLTFSRQTEQERKPLRLSSIVKESVKLLRASIPSTIDIRLKTGSETGLILGDPVQVQQVLMNLATNAAFAMRENGGTLDVELSDFVVAPATEVAAATGVAAMADVVSIGNPGGIEPGSYMRLTVRDSGTGIPREIMDRIFDPFFTTKRVGEGTGLGLSVVLGIVKQAHGHITVESAPGEGSTFSVYFPKAPEETTAEGAPADDEIPTGFEHVLFVDDEEALVEMGEELLAELGYEVTVRTSSREALALFRLRPKTFDIVVTDQTMPDLTGVQLASEILSIRPDVPIVLCTGFSHTVTEESAKAAGIRGFVMKPLTKKELARTVRRVLDSTSDEA
jgi:PAS domain S-box-containing protein